MSHVSSYIAPGVSEELFTSLFNVARKKILGYGSYLFEEINQEFFQRD
jgi:hypothetical protein